MERRRMVIASVNRLFAKCALALRIFGDISAGWLAVISDQQKSKARSTSSRSSGSKVLIDPILAPHCYHRRKSYDSQSPGAGSCRQCLTVRLLTEKNQCVISQRSRSFAVAREEARTDGSVGASRPAFQLQRNEALARAISLARALRSVVGDRRLQRACREGRLLMPPKWTQASRPQACL